MKENKSKKRNTNNCPHIIQREEDGKERNETGNEKQKRLNQMTKRRIR